MCGLPLHIKIELGIGGIDNDCERLKEGIFTCAGEKERPCIDVMNYVWLRQPDDISSTRNVPSSFSKWLSSRNAG